MATNAELKALSYQSKSLEYKVIINEVDYADDVITMSPITQRLDNRELNRYRVGTTTITLKDPDGTFSPEGDKRWVGVDVVIQAGFDNNLKDLFKGKIFRTSHNSPDSTSELTIDDALQEINRTEIEDFGVDKHYRISPSNRRSINGFYPVLDAFFPASVGSVEVKKNVSDTLTEVDEVSRQGPLNPDNYEVGPDGIITEGGEVQAAAGYPQLQYKSPFRYKDVETLIRSVLSSNGISKYSIEIPNISLADNFSSNGRVGYDVVGTAQFGTSNPITWQGYVTDVIFDSDNYYYAYNPVRGDRGNTAFILQKNKTTGEETVIHREKQQSTFTTEYWKLAKNGNIIAILATNADKTVSGDGALPDISVPEAPSYDATQSGNRSYILFLNTATDEVSTPVQQNSDFKVQVGHYYIFGQTYSDYRAENILAAQIPQQPPNVLPDTRHNFQWYNNRLYFVSVSDTHIGVSSVGESGGIRQESGIPLDGQSNQFGLDFDIVGSKLMVEATFKGDTNSRILAWSETL